MYISTLDSCKSVPSHEIPIKYIKMVKSIISPLLSETFNWCIQHGEYPTELKIAEVIPIHKTGSQVECTNYRPISLLSPFAKIFEKIIYQRLYNYVEKNGMLTTHQYGFRCNRSTSLAIYDIHERVLAALDQKKYTCAIFLDLSKAFDTVDHRVLLWKLEHQYGIRGSPLELFRSYLSHRKQCTRIENVTSKLLNVTCGCPQGSSLAPLFFSLYINDLPTASKFTTKLFADDTCLSMSSESLTDLQANVNKELVYVDNWMRHNKLSLNTSKTTYLLFCPSKRLNTQQFSISIGSQQIQRSTETKYLGVYIDDQLKWEKHIAHVERKLAQACGIMYKLRDYFGQQFLRIIYYSFAYPYLQYAIAAWGSGYAASIKTLNIKHNKILRAITRSPYRCRATPLYHDLRLLKFKDIYKLEVAKLLHSFHTGALPSTYNSLFTPITSVHHYNTRRAENQNYFHPRVNTAFGTRSICHRGPKVWEDLPRDIKSLSRLSSFKKQLRLYLLRQYHPSTIISLSCPRLYQNSYNTACSPTS
uniref:Reverse transcriptase n=1 Tax=Phallusia mammillata TaxID=59560 RepID=A0A6F9DVF5_9ASCI|nr:reverse transcriptase [Phallusia mammillata]